MTRHPGPGRRAVLAGVAVSAWTAGAHAQAVMPLAALSSGHGLPSGFAAARTGQGRPGRWDGVADATAKDGRSVAQVDADPTDNMLAKTMDRAWLVHLPEPITL